MENSADVKSVTQSLIDGGCDVIFVPNDSVVQDGVSALTELCQEKKIPTYCSSATTVASGCTATLAIDDKGIGAKTAEMAIQYFDGKKVAEIPAQVCGIDYCSVNKTALAAGGLATPTKDTVGYEVKVLEAAKYATLITNRRARCMVRLLQFFQTLRNKNFCRQRIRSV